MAIDFMHTLKHYQESKEWSVHVKEAVYFPNMIRLGDQYEMARAPFCQLVFSIYLIPIGVIKQTETFGGPVSDCQVKLDEYKHYMFEGTVVNIDNNCRFSLSNYLCEMRRLLHEVDFDKIKANEISSYQLPIT